MASDVSPTLKRGAGRTSPRAPRRSPWRRRLERWEDTYSAAAIEAASNPTGTLSAVLAQGGLLAALGYVPWLQARVQLPLPWLPILLTVIGGVVTMGAYHFKARGPVGFTLTMLDNTFYSTALVLPAVQAAPGWGLALAVIHGMMVLAFPSRVYGLTLPFALAMGIPIVVGFIVATPTAVVATVLIATYLMVLVQAQYNRARRQVEREHARLREAVEATGRLVDESTQLAFSQMALGIGHFLHELRNAQASRLINLRVLVDDHTLPERTKEVIADILNAQSREEELVRMTLDGLRDEGRAQPEPFDVGSCLRAFAAEHDALDVSLDHGSLWVAGTPHHLEVALTNLVRNARQAGAEVVQAQLKTLDVDAAELVVSDDGPGLPPERAQSVFDAFSDSTKTEGTGLGLYLTRRYVELLGGSIEVVQPGPLGGACFRIVLPTCAAPSRP